MPVRDVKDISEKRTKFIIEFSSLLYTAFHPYVGVAN